MKNWEVLLLSVLWFNQLGDLSTQIAGEYAGSEIGKVSY